MKNALSVIIPVYNSEKYLRETIDSVINQTVFKKLEIILVNDGSTDHSREICEEYASKYKNILLFEQKNSGVSSARNTGLEKITSKYVTFLDSDDVIEKDLYEKELKEIEQGKYDIVIVDFIKKHEDGKLKKYRKNFRLEWNSTEEIIADFFKGIVGGQVVDKIFRANILKNVEFSKEYKIGEDMLFTFFALRNAKKVCMNTNICGYHYIVRNSSAMMGNFSKKFFDSIKASKAMMNYYREDETLWRIAKAHYIHESCKAVEYIYRHKAQSEYKSEVTDILSEIKKYPISDAQKYLIKKQFLGFLLMRLSPKLYLFFHKLMHIG